MDTILFNTILSGIIVLGQVAMFFFFKQQIKSKNRVIEDLQTLMDTTDIKRLSEYYKSTDEIRNKRIMEEIKLEMHNFKMEQHADWGHKYDEIASFTASLLESMGKETATIIVERDMPHCKDIFSNYIQVGLDKKETGSDNKTSG